MKLIDAEIGKEYVIENIEISDDELSAFLFSLGCYSGENITVVSRRPSGCVVAIKDARYNIDKDLLEVRIALLFPFCATGIMRYTFFNAEERKRNFLDMISGMNILNLL